MTGNNRYIDFNKLLYTVNSKRNKNISASAAPHTVTTRALCPYVHHTSHRTDQMSRSRKFVSLGLFIIDEFAFADATGKPTGRSLSSQERVFLRSSSPFIPAHPAYLSFNSRSAAGELMLPSAPAYGKVFFLLIPWSRRMT